MVNQTISRMRPSLPILLALAAALCLVVFGGAPDPKQATRNAAGPMSGQSGGWSEVDRLASEQKLEQAAAAAERIRIAAEKAGNQDEWTRALIREVQLRTGLHGYETAVQFL